MKKLIIAFVLAVVMVVGFGLPAFAWGGENVQVDASPITVTGGGTVGQTATVSGTVTIVSTADAGGAFIAIAHADSIANFSASNPSGVAVVSGSSSQSDTGIGGLWVFPASADASQTYNWSANLYLDEPGYWAVAQDGNAGAWWFTVFPTNGGFDSAFGGNSLMFLVLPGNPGMIPPDGWVKFELTTMGYQHFFDWVEPKWDEGKTLAEDACTEFSANGNQYRICIPEGTEITGFNGAKINSIGIFSCNGEFYFCPMYVWFSQAVTLCELVDGEWATVVAFEQIAAGQPVLVE